MTRNVRNDSMEEAPRHRRKRKKRHIRSDHKHIYERVYVDDGSYVVEHGVKYSRYYIAKRCSICGRLGDLGIEGLNKLPIDKPLYKVNDWMELWRERYLPKSAEVKRDE